MGRLSGARDGDKAPKTFKIEASEWREWARLDSNRWARQFHPMNFKGLLFLCLTSLPLTAASLILPSPKDQETAELTQTLIIPKAEKALSPEQVLGADETFVARLSLSDGTMNLDVQTFDFPPLVPEKL